MSIVKEAPGIRSLSKTGARDCFHPTNLNLFYQSKIRVLKKIYLYSISQKNIKIE
jgi:hypothetical protein